MSNEFEEILKATEGDKVTIVGGEASSVDDPPGAGGGNIPSDNDGDGGDGGSGAESITFTSEELGWDFGEEAKTKEDILKGFTSAREELANFRESSKKYNKDVFETQSNRIKELEASNEELMGAVDPLAHFSSPESYKKEQLIKKFPGKDPAAITVIMSDKFEDLSPVDMLKLNTKFRYGFNDTKEIQDYLEEKYGVDFDDEDFEPTAMMRADAIDAKENLMEVRNAEIPEVKDYKKVLEDRKKEQDEAIAANKEAWTPVVNKALEGFSKLSLKLPDKNGDEFDFDFEFDKKQLEGVQDILLQNLGSQEVNEDNLTKIMTSLRRELLLNNFKAIFRAGSGQLLAELDEQWATETNNPRKLNMDVKHNSGKTKQEQSKEQAEEDILSGKL